MLAKNKKATGQRVIAWAVEKQGNECAPRGPYKPQAYQYLAARIMEFYTQGTVNEG
jgi:hypothetical protein